MFITNATGKKIRISELQAISEDEEREIFAWVIENGCGLSINLPERFVISIEKDK